jgi:transposase InsO family protein
VPINDCCHIDHTACDFDVSTKRLKDLGITISMDGKGRATDNSCIERFCRSAKCERIYLNEYQSISELITDVGDYIEFYISSHFFQFAIRTKMRQSLQDIIIDKGNKWHPLLDKQGAALIGQATFKNLSILEVS